VKGESSVLRMNSDSYRNGKILALLLAAKRCDLTPFFDFRFSRFGTFALYTVEPHL